MTEILPLWGAFEAIDVEAAALRLQGKIRRTPLMPLPCDDERLDLRGKMENLQETGSFKVRGALNNIAKLTEEERAQGVVASSSGNHGRALAYAARVSGVDATIVMPSNAYPNKIAACRAEGADVVLSDGRFDADRITNEIAAQGRLLIHPYDRAGTIEGAGTVGLEIAEDWPEVDVVIICVGGGGLSAGSSLALRRKLGARVRIVGAEPAGAPSMTLGIEHGGPRVLEQITTEVQGLCPPASGKLNIEIARTTFDRMICPDDATILGAQQRLVRDGDAWQAQVVEPAGACAYSVALHGMLPEEWLQNHTAERPLRVAVTISGGNPDPAQLESLRAGA